MKKNILTVIIMACTCINLILTIIIVFSVVPAMNKTNTLISKVASIIDLEIESTKTEEDEYSVEDLEDYTCAFENKQTLNLKADAGDTESHYAILESVVITFNTEAEDYENIKALIEKSGIHIQDIAKETITEYSRSTFNEKEARSKSLKRIREYYKTKSIVDVSFWGLLVS
mgnify:FL=1